MTLKLLAAGTAIFALAAGAVQAATSAGGAYAEPKQPVAYSKLDSYLRASPTRRAHGDWGIGANTASAQTGTSANASVDAPQNGRDGMMPNTSAPASANGSTSDMNTPPAGSTPMQTPPAPR